MAISTRKRVSDLSVELFNRFGIEAVSVGQISEALKISPGNFTYHYKKKSDLVMEHVNTFEVLLREGVDRLPLYSDAKTCAEAYMNLVGITYRYRFLFTGANYIIQNDLLQAARYAKLVDITKRSFVRQMKQLMAEGYMSAIDKPFTIEMLVDSIWWQWLGWLLVMQINPPGKQQSDRKLIADAVMHIFFLSHHYVARDFLISLQAELKKLAIESP